MKSIASLQGLTQDAFHPTRIASGDLNWITFTNTLGLIPCLFLFQVLTHQHFPPNWKWGREAARSNDGHTMAKLTKEKVKGCLKGSALTLATLAGVIGGVIFGLCLRQREGKYLLILKTVMCVIFWAKVLVFSYFWMPNFMLPHSSVIICIWLGGH